MMKRKIPTSLEEKFWEIIDKYKLPFVFVGNGLFVLENKNPDFISIDGSNIIIEVYSNFYKKLNNGTIKNWKQERQKIYAKYGYKTVFFNEVELTEINVLDILGG
jgi:hypothetical protein